MNSSALRAMLVAVRRRNAGPYTKYVVPIALVSTVVRTGLNICIPSRRSNLSRDVLTFASVANFLNRYVDDQVTAMTRASATMRQMRVAVVPV